MSATIDYEFGISLNETMCATRNGLVQRFRISAYTKTDNSGYVIWKFEHRRFPYMRPVFKTLEKFYTFTSFTCVHLRTLWHSHEVPLSVGLALSIRAKAILIRWILTNILLCAVRLKKPHTKLSFRHLRLPSGRLKHGSNQGSVQSPVKLFQDRVFKINYSKRFKWAGQTSGETGESSGWRMGTFRWQVR